MKCPECKHELAISKGQISYDYQIQDTGMKVFPKVMLVIAEYHYICYKGCKITVNKIEEKRYHLEGE